MRLDVAVGVGRLRARAFVGRPRRRRPKTSRTPKPSPARPRRRRWPRSVSTSESDGVDADQHQHEQEQHHHRAGVDDDLDDAEERRVLGEVEDRQADHRQRRAAARECTALRRTACRARRAPRPAPRIQKVTASPVAGVGRPRRAAARRRSRGSPSAGGRSSAAYCSCAGVAARDLARVVVLRRRCPRPSGAAARPCPAASARAGPASRR